MVEKKKTNDVLSIEKIITAPIEEEKFSLVDVDIRYTASDVFVTVYIYGEDLDIHNLEKINKKLYPLLEELSFLKDKLNLEVSSPGIFRKIKYFNEFFIFKNKDVRISLEKGITIEGKMKNYENNILEIIDKNSSTINIKVEEIKKCYLNG